MVESETSGQAAGSEPCWRLAPGVGLLVGTAIGGTERLGETLYVLVTPGGRRFLVTEPLYHLASLLAAPRTLDDLTARLGEHLGRSLDGAQVEHLVCSKLTAEGLAVRESSRGTDSPAQLEEGASP